MNAKEEYFILYEAYEHYRKTGNNHFTVLPKSPDYLLTVINNISDMLEKGFEMSFDITLSGIRFIETRRES